MTRRQEKAVEALLTSRTRKEAAQKAGIGESTLRSYFQNTEFVDAYRQAVSEVLEGTTRKAQAASARAVDVLTEIANAADAPAAARIGAADKILNHAQRLTEINDILDRLAALEQATGRGGEAL